MSVCLEILFKSGVQKKSNYKLAKYVMPKIQALNFDRAINHDGTLDNSEYEILRNTNYYYPPIDKSVDINTPTVFNFTIYDSCVVIRTIYRYSILYNVEDIWWFEKFRKEVYDIIQLFEATEIIYLPDNGSNELVEFSAMALDNEPYEVIKNALIEKYGNPVTDFKKISKESDSKEFIMDTFNDFKNE